MIAALVTGVGCNDPTGDCLKVNSLKKSSLESGWAQGSHRPTATSETLGTQVAHLSCDDY